jgi:signal transduction histidine kinase
MIARGTRKDVAEQAAKATGVAEQAAKVRAEEGVALVAHDVRTPLAIIMLEADLARSRISAIAMPELTKSLDRIAENAAYIDRLVGDLLDAGAVREGQLELRAEEVDLVKLVTETIERAVSTIERERVHVKLRGPAIVHGDAMRLERVICNLLSNAFKYSPPGTRVTLQLEVLKQRARLSVIDAGVGMTPEQARTVFDRYHRTEATRDREGYGLGLYISRQIIVAHGGRIGVASAPGAGSRFFFELPTLP